MSVSKSPVMALSGSSRRAQRLWGTCIPPRPFLEQVCRSYITSRAFLARCDQKSARVVGTPRWNIASLQRNSLIEERETALPSAESRVGVIPETFSCSSNTPSPVSASPRRFVPFHPPSWPARFRIGGHRTSARNEVHSIDGGQLPSTSPSLSLFQAPQPSPWTTARERALGREWGRPTSGPGTCLDVPPVDITTWGLVGG